MGKDLKGKELGDCIIQRQDGRYEGRYVDRFGRRRSISGKDLKDVKKRLNEAIYENEKEMNIRDSITLDEWYTKWMDVYKYNVIRDNTKRHYHQVYTKHISPYLGKMNIQDITQLDIRNLIKKLDKQGYMYETKNKVRILLVDMFNKALIDSFVKRNPARGIIIRRDEKKDISVLSVEDQSAFFDFCKGTFYDNFFNVAISTGMRMGEIAALRWEDVDLDKKVIHVRRTLVYQQYLTDTCKTFHFELPKTEGSYRDIPMNNQCEKAIKKQYIQKNVIAEKCPKSKKPAKEFEDLLFTSRFNTPLNSQVISDAIKRLVDDMNVMRDTLNEIDKFSCHTFRHTFATRCFEGGIKPKTVQAYLGHATLQMTMDLYTAVLNEHKVSEMYKLEAVLDSVENYSDTCIDDNYNNMISHNSNIIRLDDKMVANR